MNLPLFFASTGSYLVMLANHKLTKQRHEVLLKGLTFIHRYLVLRRNALSPEGVQLAFPPPLPATATAAATNTAGGPSSSSGSSSNDVEKSSTILSSTLLHEVALYQETLFNLGRAFHDIRLNSLAADQYNEALDLARRYPQLAESPNTVTRAVAHNLVQLYKHSGAVNLAFDIMRQFLVL
jgi:hypothetical protein